MKNNESGSSQILNSLVNFLRDNFTSLGGPGEVDVSRP